VSFRLHTNIYHNDNWGLFIFQRAFSCITGMLYSI